MAISREVSMYGDIQAQLIDELSQIEREGLIKRERIILTPQGASIGVGNGKTVINMCANNYLGLAQHPDILAAAHKALDDRGYGMASVRFICGTQDLHIRLEIAISQFLGTEETILYSSCWDANGGLFEILLNEQDAVISDELNHASIIDGIRLCKAQRHRYKNNDMASLESSLQQCPTARRRLIATDGVFSMDGTIANLAEICALADKYQAMVMVDDSHAVGFIGPRGRGTHEMHSVMDRVDILTGTFGKALGGASGGYASGRKEIISLLRQRSRPYLFSNTLAPAIAAGTLKGIEMLSASMELPRRLMENTRYFREGIANLGFRIVDGTHPIVPIMLGEAALASRLAEAMLRRGVYVVGFSFPVVPRGKARVRTQISAAHGRNDLESVLAAFADVKRELEI